CINNQPTPVAFGFQSRSNFDAIGGSSGGAVISRPINIGGVARWSFRALGVVSHLNPLNDDQQGSWAIPATLPGAVSDPYAETVDPKASTFIEFLTDLPVLASRPDLTITQTASNIPPCRELGDEKTGIGLLCGEPEKGPWGDPPELDSLTLFTNHT